MYTKFEKFWIAEPGVSPIVLYELNVRATPDRSHDQSLCTAAIAVG
jgi:hypothetical protein